MSLGNYVAVFYCIVLVFVQYGYLIISVIAQYLKYLILQTHSLIIRNLTSAACDERPYHSKVVLYSYRDREGYRILSPNYHPKPGGYLLSDS